MSDCCNSCTALDDPTIHSCLDRKTIDSAEATSVEQPTEPMDVSELLALMRPTDDHGCSPGNGGIGGLRPYCAATGCGAIVEPMIPCDRPDCYHRTIG